MLNFRRWQCVLISTPHIEEIQLEVDQVRKKLIFPKIEILNKSLSQFYRHVTFEWEDLVERISIKTGAKFGDTNFTIFVFVNTDSNSSNITNGNYLKEKIELKAFE